MSIAGTEPAEFEVYENETRRMLKFEENLRKKLAEEYRYKLRNAEQTGYDRAKADYRRTEARWTRGLQSAGVLAAGAVLVMLVSLIPGCVSYMDNSSRADKAWYTDCIAAGGSVWERPDSDTDYCVVGKVVSTK